MCYDRQRPVISFQTAVSVTLLLDIGHLLLLLPVASCGTLNYCACAILNRVSTKTENDPHHEVTDIILYGLSTSLCHGDP